MSREEALISFWDNSLGAIVALTPFVILETCFNIWPMALVFLFHFAVISNWWDTRKFLARDSDSIDASVGSILMTEIIAYFLLYVILFAYGRGAWNLSLIFPILMCISILDIPVGYKIRAMGPERMWFGFVMFFVYLVFYLMFHFAWAATPRNSAIVLTFIFAVRRAVTYLVFST